jgi:hypothetical protein
MWQEFFYQILWEVGFQKQTHYILNSVQDCKVTLGKSPVWVPKKAHVHVSNESIL